MNKQYTFFKVIYRNIYDYFKMAKIWAVLEQLSFFFQAIVFYIGLELIENLFDKVEKNASTNLIIVALLFVGINKVVTEVLVFISKYLLSKNAYSNMGKFMVKFQKKLDNIEPYHFEDANFLDAVQRTKECIEYEKLGYFASSCIQIFVYYSFVIVLTGFYLFQLYPMLVFIVVFAFLPSLFGQILQMRFFERFENDTLSLRRNAKVHKDAIVNKTYFKETRMLGIFHYFFRAYKNSLALIMEKQWKVNKKIFIYQIVLTLISIIGLVFAIGVLFVSVIRLEISISVFATVFYSLSQFFAIIDEFVQGQLMQFGELYTQAKNVYKLMDMEERTFCSEILLEEDKIDVKNIYFAYPNSDNFIIKGIDLKIERNKTYAIVGQNGSGKSTLIRLLLGIYKPQKGSIHFFGTNTTKYRGNNLYKNSSAVFQDFQRYKMTLMDNVAISDSDEIVLENKVKTCLLESNCNKQIALTQMLSPEFDGIDLSGGQWQRVAIARAIYRNHDLIVLDEPTSAIDPVEEANLFTYFKELSKNKTSLIVTHRLASTQFADEVIVMQAGTIVEKGTHAELMKLEGVYYHMWISQEYWYK